jgi:hypothetical protein
MKRSLAVAALLVTCLAACGGDDGIDGPTSIDSGADGTTPVEASVDANGAVAESGTNDTGADGNVADTGTDGSLGEAGLDAGLTDANTDGATTDAGLEAGPACTVNNTAPTITETVSDAAAAPVQTGGSLVNGTYFLTSYTYFGGSPGCAGTSIKWTLVVTATNATSGNLGETIESPVAAGSSQNCANQVPYATGGANLLAPDGGPSATTYTATGTQLTLVTVDNGTCGTAVTVFTKQ